METKFYKLSKELFQNSRNDITFSNMEILDESIEWVKAFYARDFYWALNEDYYQDVLTNEEYKEVTIDEYQTEEGQHIEWNKFLREIRNACKKGTLLDKAINNSFVQTNVVVKIDEEYYTIEAFGEIENGEDISEEIKEMIRLKINPSEIEEFVKTHSAEEVEEKYAVKDYEDEFWVL